MSHTQGEWTYRKAENAYGPVDYGYYVVMCGNVCVADVIGEIKGERDENGEDKFISPEECEANARLMARSPQMEAALEIVLLFHSAEPWGPESDAKWNSLQAITGHTTGRNHFGCTTKSLCDTIREVLGREGGT